MQRIFIGIILSTFAVVSIAVALGSKGSFDQIACHRRERAYTVCKMEKVRLINLVSTTTSFWLKSAAVEEYQARDSEGNKYTAYRVRFTTHTEPVDSIGSPPIPPPQPELLNFVSANATPRHLL
jgi:hypothetical protein